MANSGETQIVNQYSTDVAANCYSAWGHVATTTIGYPAVSDIATSWTLVSGETQSLANDFARWGQSYPQMYVRDRDPWYDPLEAFDISFSLDLNQSANRIRKCDQGVVSSEGDQGTEDAERLYGPLILSQLSGSDDGLVIEPWIPEPLELEPTIVDGPRKPQPRYGWRG